MSPERDLPFQLPGLIWPGLVRVTGARAVVFFFRGRCHLCVLNFFSNNGKLFGRLDAEPDRTLRHADDGDLNVVADPNLLANFSRKHQHGIATGKKSCNRGE